MKTFHWVSILTHNIFFSMASACNLDIIISPLYVLCMQLCLLHIQAEREVV